MPRQARLDAPGLLQHVIARGLERRTIFPAPKDSNDFLSRIEKSLQKHSHQILAWCLMPNHFHFLIRSGPRGLIPFMRSVMSGYAGSFNRRHRRAGYLFQNRYKSIVCDEQTYLLELVRYIHLNPVRAGLVKSVRDLAAYPYTGHGCLMGARPNAWQETKEILQHFGRNRTSARKRYEVFVNEGVKEGDRQDLRGGGLRRSLGLNSLSLRKPEGDERQMYDSRILGPGTFVEEVLKSAEKSDKIKGLLARQKINLAQVSKRVAAYGGIDEELLYVRGRQDDVSRAKSLLIYMGVEYLGQTTKSMAELTRMSVGAASRARSRGFDLFRNSSLRSWLKVN